MYFAGFFACVTIVMTVRPNIPPVGGLPLYAEKWTIKCSSIESSIFPITLNTLLEGSNVSCGPVHKLRTPMNNQSPLGIEDLMDLAALGRPVT